MSRETDAEARRRRLAEALRENLKRRKARARAVAKAGPRTADESGSGEGVVLPDEDEPEK